VFFWRVAELSAHERARETTLSCIRAGARRDDIRDALVSIHSFGEAVAAQES
jgi:hypothetical protein